jgi:hypothetical protein
MLPTYSRLVCRFRASPKVRPVHLSNSSTTVSQKRKAPIQKDFPSAGPLGTWGSASCPRLSCLVALLYAGAGSWLTMKIGGPLVPLNF